MKIVIIGAGIGGLATANLLARDGHEVHIYEKNNWLGGRAGRLTQDGFTFDTGPSWYLMPEVFKRYFEHLSISVDDELSLARLSPAYKVFFENHQPLTITSNLDKDAQTFESIEPGAGEALTRYVKGGDEIYHLSIGHFLYANFNKPGDLINAKLLKHSRRMARLALTSLHTYVSKFVRDQRLQQILEYPMVFLGTSPFSAPAIYSLMSALDFREGVFYPKGGIYSIINLLSTYGKNHGVQYHLNSPVSRIHVKDKRASAIELTSEEIIEADVIISNADLRFTETQLLDAAYRSYPSKYWQKKEAGPSALLLYLGIKGKLPLLEHHNLLFVDAWKENFDSMYTSKQAPEKASIYIGKSSASDASVAPKGHENIFVLIPLPAGNTISDEDIPKLTDQYLSQIQDMTGVDLTKDVVTRAQFTPHDFSETYNAWQASMLGQSHRLTQSAFFRTKNKSKKLSNLYYVGANTLPGIGLPMCLIGAELVYGRVKEDHTS